MSSSPPSVVPPSASSSSSSTGSSYYSEGSSSASCGARKRKGKGKAHARDGDDGDNGHGDKVDPVAYFPQEIWSEFVLSRLNFATLAACRRVSRAWRQVASDPGLYRRVKYSVLFSHQVPDGDLGWTWRLAEAPHVLGGIRDLTLWVPNLTAEGIAWLGDVTPPGNLTSLNIDPGKRENLTPDMVAAIPRSVVSLNFGTNRYDPTTIESLSELTQLEALGLPGYKFVDAVPVQGLPNLRRLFLYTAKLGDPSRLMETLAASPCASVLEALNIRCFAPRPGRGEWYKEVPKLTSLRELEFDLGPTDPVEEVAECIGLESKLEVVVMDLGGRLDVDWTLVVESLPCVKRLSVQNVQLPRSSHRIRWPETIVDLAVASHGVMVAEDVLESCPRLRAISGAFGSAGVKALLAAAYQDDRLLQVWIDDSFLFGGDGPGSKFYADGVWKIGRQLANAGHITREVEISVSWRDPAAI